MAMKREDKDKWVAALRSGDYKQGHTFLRFKDTFCCLGVACDVLFGPDGWVDRGFTGFHYGANSYSSPSPELLDKMGLTSSAMNQLITLNDAERKSFPEIADWIEEYVAVVSEK